MQTKEKIKEKERFYEYFRSVLTQAVGMRYTKQATYQRRHSGIDYNE